MEVYTVSLFGHRQLDYPVLTERTLEMILQKLLETVEYVDFLLGRDGEFDLLAASVIRRLQKNGRSANCSLIWVLPYPTADLQKNREDYLRYYNDIEICDASAEGHFRGAHQKRNRVLVDRSDLVLFWVDHPSGGAYHTLLYALRQGKDTLNLANALENEDDV